MSFRAAGETHVGNVRDANEDSLLIDPDVGLYGVLDGMGGHNAGDVASARARDVIHEFVRANRESLQPRDLLAAAFDAASAAVHGEALARRDRHGMGTTAVCCLIIDDHHVVIAHVGDSRAYLVREGRLQQLTRDHTVVAELISNGAITPEEAVHHPYKSILSRNLGAKPNARTDILDLSLSIGDQVLLCSDGLTGFASTEAIEQLLSGAESPADVSRDLIELALRGGGGDNVSAIVIEAGRQKVARSTQVLRTSGAVAWWQRRATFLAEARKRGLPRSPICAVLSPDEALEIVAGNLCEAVFHDLEQSTGINVWTYSENLARGWFDQDGEYQVLRSLLDTLRDSADAVIADIASAGAEFAMSLSVAVTRAFTVAEMAIGGLLAERLRAVEAIMVEEHTRQQKERRLTDQPTIPFMGAVRVDPPTPDVAACLQQAVLAAQQRLSATAELAAADECLQHAHRVISESTGEAMLAARELYGARGHEEAGVVPVLEALDQARAVHLQAVKQQPVSDDVKAAALRRAAGAHQALYCAIAQLVVEAGHPVSDALQAAAERTAILRARVGKVEAQLARLEREFVTRVDRDPLTTDEVTRG